MHKPSVLLHPVTQKKALRNQFVFLANLRYSSAQMFSGRLSGGHLVLASICLETPSFFFQGDRECFCVFCFFVSFPQRAISDHCVQMENGAGIQSSWMKNLGKWTPVFQRQMSIILLA